jgi:hypothetical protein
MHSKYMLIIFGPVRSRRVGGKRQLDYPLMPDGETRLGFESFWCHRFRHLRRDRVPACHFQMRSIVGETSGDATLAVDETRAPVMSSATGNTRKFGDAILLHGRISIRPLSPQSRLRWYIHLPNELALKMDGAQASNGSLRPRFRWLRQPSQDGESAVYTSGPCRYVWRSMCETVVSASSKGVGPMLASHLQSSRPRKEKA